MTMSTRRSRARERNRTDLNRKMSCIPQEMAFLMPDYHFQYDEYGVLRPVLIEVEDYAKRNEKEWEREYGLFVEPDDVDITSHAILEENQPRMQTVSTKGDSVSRSTEFAERTRNGDERRVRFSIPVFEIPGENHLLVPGTSQENLLVTVPQANHSNGEGTNVEERIRNGRRRQAEFWSILSQNADSSPARTGPDAVEANDVEPVGVRNVAGAAESWEIQPVRNDPKGAGSSETQLIWNEPCKIQPSKKKIKSWYKRLKVAVGEVVSESDDEEDSEVTTGAEVAVSRLENSAVRNQPAGFGDSVEGIGQGYGVGIARQAAGDFAADNSSFSVRHPAILPHVSTGRGQWIPSQQSEAGFCDHVSFKPRKAYISEMSSRFNAPSRRLTAAMPYDHGSVHPRAPFDIKCIGIGRGMKI